MEIITRDEYVEVNCPKNEIKEKGKRNANENLLVSFS